jgi:hypothetical protein
MTGKVLGKIESVKFGLTGYNDDEFGICFKLSGGGYGVQTNTSFWDYNQVKRDKECQWTEEDRAKRFVEIVKYISNLLEDAGVNTIDRLKNIPIEMEFKENLLKSFRILKEVL